MSVELLVAHDAWDIARLQAIADLACNAALGKCGLEPLDWDVSVMACDDARIALLNEDFREKPTSTNVLSWPSVERGADEDGALPFAPEGPDTELGDIAIAYETCLREAEEQDKSFDAHVTHLLVHSTLHLLGFDHIRPADARLMEGIEVEILASLGLPNPYE